MAASVKPTRLVWNEPAYRVFSRGRTGAVARDLGRRALLVTNQAKVNATGVGGGPKVRTGRLRSSITFALGQDGEGLFADVGTNVSYARYVELGTRPHVIRPRTRKALAWKGARHPVRKVNHPGSKPHPFLRPALRASR